MLRKYTKKCMEKNQPKKNKRKNKQQKIAKSNNAQILYELAI